MSFQLSFELQRILSTELAYHYRIVPYEIIGNTIKFKTDTQNLEELEKELKIVLNKDLILENDTSENINRYLSTNYRIAKQDKVSSIKYSTDFLEKIVLTAKEIGSSDIHFEPYETKARVRFRLDGKLKEQFHIEKEIGRASCRERV